MQKNDIEIDLAKLRVANKIRYTEKEVTAWLKLFCKGDLFDMKFRQRIIDTFINSIFLYDDRVIIFYNIRGGKQISYIDMLDATKEAPDSVISDMEKGTENICILNDTLDYISDVRGQVYANGSEKAENISKYLTKVDSEKKQILFAFPEAGTYQVWFSVSDSHGAWSDWAIFNYTVTERPVPSITLSEYCVQQNSTPNWYKYSEALAYDNEDADYIFNAVTRPLPDDYRDLVGSEIRIRGKVAYDDGPVANKTVRIYMSVPGCYPIEGTVQTDSSGNFDYHITQKEFFEMTTGRYAPGGVNGVIGEWAYVSGYSTKFISQTKLIIACDGAVEEIPVSTVTGLAALKIVGKWGQRPGGQWQVWN